MHLPAEHQTDHEILADVLCVEVLAELSKAASGIVGIGVVVVGV